MNDEHARNYYPIIRTCCDYEYCNDCWAACGVCLEPWPCPTYEANHSENQIDKQKRWAGKGWFPNEGRSAEEIARNDYSKPVGFSIPVEGDNKG